MSERRWREAGRPHRGAGCSPGLPWGGHAESSRGARGPPGAADRGAQQGGRRPRPARTASRSRPCSRGSAVGFTEPRGIKDKGPEPPGGPHSSRALCQRPHPPAGTPQGNLPYRNHQGWHTGFCTLTATTTAERVTWLPGAGAPLLPSYLPP